jgi:DNA mismatch repair protein MutL
LVDTDEGLQIIDQHIAHERYLYEKLKNEKNHSSQLLLTSEIVEIDSEQLSVLQENFIILSKLGYELELFPMEGYSRTLNNNAVALQAPIEKKVKINTDFGVKLKRVPQIVSDKSPSKVINDLIEALNSSPDILEDEIIMRTACSASVKAGEKLSFCQMEQLVIDWQNTKFPKTCPHGRKISHIISKKELANFFNRIDNSQH